MLLQIVNQKNLNMLDRFNKSSNPMLKKFDNSKPYEIDYNSSTGTLDAPTTAMGQMTLNGTLNKTVMLIGIMLLSAFVTVAFFPSQTMFYVGAGGAFILSIVLSFKPQWSPTLAPMYAISKGIVVGLASVIYTSISGMDNIIFYALGLTVSTLLVMLFIYRSGIIPITQRFKMIVSSAVMGIMLMYLVVFIMNIAFGYNAAFLHDGSPLAIGLSLFIIVVAALFLLVDFDMIDQGVKTGAPKYMEWYGGFALLFTLAWIYLEFLRLLAMLASGD